jgi:hypothetical protein
MMGTHSDPIIGERKAQPYSSGQDRESHPAETHGFNSTFFPGGWREMVVVTLTLALLAIVGQVLLARARVPRVVPRYVHRQTIFFDTRTHADPILLAMAVSPQGSIGMLDTKSGTAQVFTSEGTLIRQTPGTLPGENRPVLRPLGLALGHHDEVFIADTGNQRVLRFTADGVVLSLGEPGVSKDQFVFPTSLVVSERSLLVLDAGLCRIQQFGYDGRRQGQTGNKGEGPGQFQVPTTMVEDPVGNLVVIDTRPAVLSSFDPFLAFQHQRALSTGAERRAPSRIAFAGDGLAFFLYKEQQEIIVFHGRTAIDRLTPQRLNLRSASWTDLVGRGNHLYLLDGTGRRVEVFEIL